ncbi:S-adenosylmethionine-dependent methyltransferase, putative [Plasmodium chabaudi chabaudi]|uniref:18S rRNA (Guanine-N(7))-methyltransferase, putative n=1 Tax=Plasmodium chabaudi chabaudi TaxID=31271 RepID=A0A077TSH8_PLACU|nr:18S rRNA (guanine-N(7))-methyltransferase, putative [Plasmodium chabaudi chabaudi]SCN62399.1 S-adenosylmethionine-dependent methyltransferase, putative [Plasmodium chabaudi chabaudi]VTZ69846.1 18S rRNA (guanine-N(7))-methyltransferase, putative [Plasmodium chabaudi chabaudi]|eukprot:XP_016654343.1 S-adenosylmethionine-dependent methyltransferase, putative [Plasmodium chabaudi chabaudi]
MVRPEYSSPPEFFYNEDEAKKYVRNSRIRDIQSQMTERAIELLLLPDTPCLLLDIGCGSGISGMTLNEYDHFWIGIDISIHMLKAGVQNEATEGGDMILADMGKMMRFQPSIFDGVVSISALQWLCNWDRKSESPTLRLNTFFKWLYYCLKRGARAVFQFYPDSPQQIETLTNAAIKSGFGGGVVVDFPNSAKSKKYYLCLWAGSATITNMNEPVENEEEDMITQERRRSNKKTKKIIKKNKEWILKKKEQRRKKNLEVKRDSKYTGRKRKTKY